MPIKLVDAASPAVSLCTAYEGDVRGEDEELDRDELLRARLEPIRKTASLP